MIGATCTVFSSASATACSIVFLVHLFLELLCSFIDLSISCTIHTDCIFCFVGGSINYFVCDATCVNFFATSATSCCIFYSANCAVFCAASAACPGSTCYGNTTTSKQTHDTDPGKDLFQFLCIHGQISQVKNTSFSQ